MRVALSAFKLVTALINISIKSSFLTFLTQIKLSLILMKIVNDTYYVRFYSLPKITGWNNIRFNNYGLHKAACVMANTASYLRRLN